MPNTTTRIELLEALQRYVRSIDQWTRAFTHMKTKGWIIAGMVLLIVTAIISGYLSAENSYLSENDVKFRMIRQAHPAIAYQIDTLYHQNPDSMEA